MILNYISAANLLITTQQKENNLKINIDKDVQHHDKDKHVKLIKYHKKRKVKNLFIKKKTTNIKLTNISENYNIFYKYTCDNVKSTCYIGHTTTTVQERIKQHSSVKRHFTEPHKEIITGSMILPNIHRVVSHREFIWPPKIALNY